MIFARSGLRSLIHIGFLSFSNCMIKTILSPAVFFSFKKIKNESFIEGYPSKKLTKKAKNGPLQSINPKNLIFSFIKKKKKTAGDNIVLIMQCEKLRNPI